MRSRPHVAFGWVSLTRTTPFSSTAATWGSSARARASASVRVAANPSMACLYVKSSSPSCSATRSRAVPATAARGTSARVTMYSPATGSAAALTAPSPPNVESSDAVVSSPPGGVTPSAGAGSPTAGSSPASPSSPPPAGTEVSAAAGVVVVAPGSAPGPTGCAAAGAIPASSATRSPTLSTPRGSHPRAAVKGRAAMSMSSAVGTPDRGPPRRRPRSARRDPTDPPPRPTKARDGRARSRVEDGRTRTEAAGLFPGERRDLGGQVAEQLDHVGLRLRAVELEARRRSPGRATGEGGG